MKIKNIKWDIDMDNIYIAIDEMPAEKAAAALGVSSERYARLTLFERHDLAEALLCDDEDMKAALLGLPDEIEVELDDVEAVSEWLFDKFGCLSDGFEIVDESPSVNPVVNLAPMTDGVFKDGRAYRILSIPQLTISASGELKYGDVEVGIYEQDSETPWKTTMRISELLSETKQIGDLLLQKNEHNVVIKDKTTLYSKVMDEYAKYDVELSTEHFDFDVDMEQGDIVYAYARLQNRINADSVLVNPMWLQQEGKERYKGNCKEFLQSLNNSSDFGRIAEGEFIDFAL